LYVSHFDNENRYRVRIRLKRYVRNEGEITLNALAYLWIRLSFLTAWLEGMASVPGRSAVHVCLILQACDQAEWCFRLKRISMHVSRAALSDCERATRARLMFAVTYSAVIDIAGRSLTFVP
jgi:hypothetical protein